MAIPRTATHFRIPLFFFLIAQASGATINVPADQPTIQAGIDAAVPGDEVVVAPGTYNEAVNFNGLAVVTLRSSDGPDVTTIDGTGLNDSVVKCISGEGADTVLEGFTITGGTGTPVGPTRGGGMYIFGSSPTITNCNFTDNSAAQWGGGIFNEFSNPIVSGCDFGGNSASIGGAIYNTSSSPTVTDCTFDGNTANQCSGMFNTSNSSPTVTNCVFSGNMAATSDGGGMINWDGSPTVTNCTFTGNTARRGGALFNNNGSIRLMNCLFIGNTSNSNGGALYNADASALINCTFRGNSSTHNGGAIFTTGYMAATNCILWANTYNGGIDENAQIYTGGSVIAVKNSCVQGWTGVLGGVGNIGDNPLFVTGPQGSVYLSQKIVTGQSLDSPCLDTGCGLATDFFISGTTRTDEVDDVGTVDMGFHYSGVLGATTFRADLDFDGYVDIFDFLTFSNCFNGALNPPTAICANCRADIDLDGDVDQNDFLTFSNCFNGAMNPPKCP